MTPSREMLICGQSSFTCCRVDHVAVDPEQLVHLRALLLHDERAVGVREREVPVLREHEVEVQILRELLVELDALLVEGRALGRPVVGADDRRVAAGGTRADVALLEDRDVVDAVMRGEVVRRRETVRAAADDDDVVVPLELAGALEDLLLEEDVLHSARSERVDADRAAAERRRPVDRDLPEVVAVLLREDDPVGVAARVEHVRRDVRDLAARREVCRCVSRRITVSASGPATARMPSAPVTSSTSVPSGAPSSRRIDEDERASARSGSGRRSSPSSASPVPA